MVEAEHHYLSGRKYLVSIVAGHEQVNLVVAFTAL